MSLLFSSKNGDDNYVISCSERGLNYGDGHFTTCLIEQGKIKNLEAHLNRLEVASQLLGLNYSNFPWLRAYIIKLASQYDQAVLKIMFTAGEGGRGYSRADTIKANVYITISEFPKHYLTWQQQGITLGLANCCLSSHPVLSQVKHLSKLEQVLIKKEVDNSDYDELLVKTGNGEIVETSTSNFFWKSADNWYTPTLKQSGLNGLIRQEVLNSMPSIIEQDCDEGQLQSANAMFITNSLMGIVPVKQYNDRKLSIDDVHKIKAVLTL